MKHKLLKFNAVLLLGLVLAPLQGQTTMNVKATAGTQTAYTLSGIRKLTFPTTGNMVVTKITGITDTYARSGVRYLKFDNAAVTGIDPVVQANGSLVLYPNPVVDVLNIQLVATENETATVALLSMEGKVLYKAQLSSTTKLHQVDVSPFPSGIYLCRVNNGTSIETSKFFKQ